MFVRPLFVRPLWRDLFKLAGIQLRFSTVFHPHIDGQSEVVNKVIAMYLRCDTENHPRVWVVWLLRAEYCYNTSYHLALHATMFEVVYGRQPPPLLPHTPGTTATAEADALPCDRDLFPVDIHECLL